MSSEMSNLATALTTALRCIVLLRSVHERFATPTDATPCAVPVALAQSR